MSNLLLCDAQGDSFVSSKESEVNELPTAQSETDYVITPKSADVLLEYKPETSNAAQAVELTNAIKKEELNFGFIISRAIAQMHAIAVRTAVFNVMAKGNAASRGKWANGEEEHRRKMDEATKERVDRLKQQARHRHIALVEEGRERSPDRAPANRTP